MEGISQLFWLFVIFSAIAPMLQQRMLTYARLQLLRRIEKSRGSRVMTLIHRQETMSLLGFPVARYIDIEDSELVLQGIRLTPPEMPIDLIMHTPGGLVLAAGQIAHALAGHPGKVTVFVPHYAMSGGTLIALAADEVVMDENAVLGPVDPQLGEYPAASILAAVKVENPNRDDRTLILADLAAKAIRQVEETVFGLVRERMGEAPAHELARTLSEGRWTHDYPLTAAEAKRLGLPVQMGLPAEIYDLMRLYPQPSQRRPSVEYVPTHYHPAPHNEPVRREGSHSHR
jgi:ClpP class serine protease